MYTAKEIEDRVAAATAAAQPFRPISHYDAANDALEFFASNENCYAEHIDALVTVYYGMDTGAVVGMRLKKVRRFFKEFLKNAPGFRNEVHDRRILVEHLFTAKIWSSTDNPEDARVLTYRQLREIAKENGVEAEIDDLAELCPRTHSPES